MFKEIMAGPLLLLQAFMVILVLHICYWMQVSEQLSKQLFFLLMSFANLEFAEYCPSWQIFQRCSVLFQFQYLLVRGEELSSANSILYWICSILIPSWRCPGRYTEQRWMDIAHEGNSEWLCWYCACTVRCRSVNTYTQILSIASYQAISYNQKVTFPLLIPE